MTEGYMKIAFSSDSLLLLVSIFHIVLLYTRASPYSFSVFSVIFPSNKLGNKIFLHFLSEEMRTAVGGPR